MASVGENAAPFPSSLAARLNAWACGVAGYVVLAATVVAAASLVTWNIADPSLTHATSGPTRNLLGPGGAIFSDLVMQLLGLAGVFVILPPAFWALALIGNRRLEGARSKLLLAPAAVVLLACAASSLPKIAGWPMPYGLGGALGDFALGAVTRVLAMIRPERASVAAGLFCFAGGIVMFIASLGLTQRDLKLIFKAPHWGGLQLIKRAWRRLGEMSEPRASAARREPMLGGPTPPHFLPCRPTGRPLPPPSIRRRGPIPSRRGTSRPSSPASMLRSPRTSTPSSSALPGSARRSRRYGQPAAMRTGSRRPCRPRPRSVPRLPGIPSGTP